MKERRPPLRRRYRRLLSRLLYESCFEFANPVFELRGVPVRAASLGQLVRLLWRRRHRSYSRAANSRFLGRRGIATLFVVLETVLARQLQVALVCTPRRLQLRAVWPHVAPALTLRFNRRHSMHCGPSFAVSRPRNAILPRGTHGACWPASSSFPFRCGRRSLVRRGGGHRKRISLFKAESPSSHACLPFARWVYRGLEKRRRPRSAPLFSRPSARSLAPPFNRARRRAPLDSAPLISPATCWSRSVRGCAAHTN